LADSSIAPFFYLLSDVDEVSSTLAASMSSRKSIVLASAPPDSYVGSLVGTGMKFAIVVGRFNDLVTKLLLEGALDHFERHGVPRSDVDVSFEPKSKNEAAAVVQPPSKTCTEYLAPSVGCLT